MLKKSDLIKYFENGIKNTSEIKIGTEHEKFIYHKSDLSLVPYSGDVSINSIFDDFIKDGWTPIKENKNISPEDLDLIKIVDNVDDTVEHIMQFHTKNTFSPNF